MFTGIVQGKAKVTSIVDHSEDQFRRITLSFPADSLSGVAKGASIAINGTCLTVTEYDTELSTAVFDVIAESLDKTNLGDLAVGHEANFERAAKIGDEIGGHLMSGHVLCPTSLIERVETAANVQLVFKTPVAASPYILEKGFVGLNGCSLTLAQVEEDRFSVFLIPETLDVTTFGKMVVGDRVNLEVDPQTQTIVETIKRLKLSL